MVLKLIQNIRSKLKTLRKGPEKAEEDSAQGVAVKPEKRSGKPVEPRITGADTKPKRKRTRRRKSGTEKGPAQQVTTPEETWDPSVFQVAAEKDKLRFQDLDLPDPVLHAIHDLGFLYCTPIQKEILPPTLAGKDASGRAQTGTGKTAAFLISVLTRMIRNPCPDRKEGTPRILIIAPTRELVIQIAKEAEELSRYCKANIAQVFGGMDYVKQKKILADQVVDIVVATPGRLIDFIQHDEVNLRKIETLIIDEADRMLDMGFIPQVRRIIRATPPKDRRQTLLFSATLTPEVMRLSEQWTRNPVTVEIEPEQVEVDTVEQLVYLVENKQKIPLLYNIITRQDLKRVMVFCNRKDETRRLTDLMNRYRLSCEMLSGDVPQKKRIRILDDFRAGKIRVLVATDVAGRGIHVEGVSHVINYTLPNDPENYVHRIGRTGRAGATGISVSFACEDDSFYIPDIESFLGHTLPCIHPEEDWLTLPPAPPGSGKKPPAEKKGGRPRTDRRRPRPRK